MEYLREMETAVSSLKRCEKILLELPDPDKNYDKAHKLLVKIRRRLGDVEKVREGN